MSRPRLVMLVNAQTPYRLALHLRIARELPQVELVSLFTHELSNAPWSLASPPEIGPVSFGQGEMAMDAPRRPLAEWGKGGRIIRYFGEHPPAAVVLHGYNDAGRLRVLRWCNREGVPVFLWGDSNAKSDRATGLKRAVKNVVVRSILARTTGIFACGTLGREYFLNYGADPERIYFVPVEPDYDQILRLPGEVIGEVAQKFELSPARRRIIYSGRLAAEKRVDLLLSAWRAIALQRPEWDLLLAGDGPLRGELEASVPTELKQRTRFLGFQADQQTVSALYRNSDVLCLPSDYEPWALVINEAAAAGLAIVSSDVVGAAPELVKDDVNGKIFTSKDLGSLTSALLEVTDWARIDRLKAGSHAVLADWRRRGDPIVGLRTALQKHGILPAAGGEDRA